MGTAGFGALLEHSLPIFVGGFRPDGFANVVGRKISDFGVLEGALLIVDAASDDVEDGAGCDSCSDSVLSSILMHLLHFL